MPVGRVKCASWGFTTELTPFPPSLWVRAGSGVEK